MFLPVSWPWLFFIVILPKRTRAYVFIERLLCTVLHFFAALCKGDWVEINFLCKVICRFWTETNWMRWCSTTQYINHSETEIDSEITIDEYFSTDDNTYKHRYRAENAVLSHKPLNAKQSLLFLVTIVVVIYLELAHIWQLFLAAHLLKRCSPQKSAIIRDRVAQNSFSVRQNMVSLAWRVVKPRLENWKIDLPNKNCLD